MAYSQIKRVEGDVNENAWRYGNIAAKPGFGGERVSATCVELSHMPVSPYETALSPFLQRLPPGLLGASSAAFPDAGSPGCCGTGQAVAHLPPRRPGRPEEHDLVLPDVSLDPMRLDNFRPIH